MADFSLDDLERLVAERASADAAASYTRSLLDEGAGKCAKKLGEEGVELALAVASGGRDHVVAEAADLLYHLVVALKVRDVPLADVFSELGRRTAQSGHAEKASRTGNA
jgi:phosphoribosyl-ATP pyrophosphohydrolase